MQFANACDQRINLMKAFACGKLDVERAEPITTGRVDRKTSNNVEHRVRRASIYSGGVTYALRPDQS